MTILKTLAVADAGDLSTVSALLQDAVCTVGDMAFLPRQHRFAATLNRFRWENGEKGRAERLRCGLHFDGVLKVEQSRIRQDDRAAVLSLLALTFQEGAEGAGIVQLAFSGGGAIRLHVECLEGALNDLSAPWPAKARPHHDLDP